MGVGLNLYDVMSVERGRPPLAPLAPLPRRARARRRGGRRRGGGGVLEPRAPPRDQRRGGARAAARAGPPRADQRLPVLRLPDRRRAPGPDRARRGRALRGRVRQPRRGGRPARAARAARAASRCATARAARASRCAPPTSSTPPACGPTSCDPRSSTRRPSCRASARAAAPTSCCAPPSCRCGAGRSCPPAGGARSSPCRGSGTRSWAPPTTTTRARSSTSRPPVDGHRVPARGRQRLLRHGASGPSDLTGAFAGVRPLISTGDPKKSVDISRKAELYETSSGHDHDHRRQAHDLAADGEDGGRPASSSATPATPPAGPTKSRSARPSRPISCRASRGCPRRPTRRSRDATATPPATCSSWPPRAASWPSRSSRACPTCWPRWRSRPAASRPAASATCCCGAPASALLAGRELAPGEDGAAPAPARRAGDVLARELGWDEQRLELELERFEQEARAEGVVPSCWRPGRVRAGGEPTEHRARALSAPRRTLRACELSSSWAIARG